MTFNHNCTMTVKLGVVGDIQPFCFNASLSSQSGNIWYFCLRFDSVNLSFPCQPFCRLLRHVGNPLPPLASVPAQSL